MQTAKTVREAPWSQNAVGSLVALFFCAPLAPLLALLALRECARHPGMKGRGLALAVLVVWLLCVTLVVMAFLLASPETLGVNG